MATDFAGKCVLIATVMTILERTLLPDRPVFFITAGQRGGGKTTTLIMLFLAAALVFALAAARTASEARIGTWS